MHLFNFTSRIPYVGNYFTKDQGPRAPDIAEKLSQLTVGSNRVPSLASDKYVDMKARHHGNTMTRPLPPVGTRTWQAPSGAHTRCQATGLSFPGSSLAEDDDETEAAATLLFATLSPILLLS